MSENVEVRGQGPGSYPDPTMSTMHAKSDDGRVWLSVPTIAERTDSSESTVRRWITSGRLPAARIGGVVRVRAEDLDALFEAAS